MLNYDGKTFTWYKINCEAEFEEKKWDNQYRYIKEEQIIHWHKEKVQKDKQRSTKHTHKTKDRVTRTSQKTGVKSGAPEGWSVPDPLVAPV